ncbi:KRAB-A domain-containing protein 2-like [Physella acuta]|uniref:KRAB-A domain-containing protein 2-like n=1 Tax=Physella acuta TaxID=109671 RepID=UPI0027DCF99F|nr:KRAB-A domain-containing protein 2-like [Physella acuta]
MASSDENSMQGEDCIEVKAEPTCEMKTMFMDALNTLLQEKANNSGILSPEKYLTFIEDVKQARVKQTKSSVDYRRLRKYDILEVEGEERLIVPITEDSSALLYYVHTDELFDLLNETHLKIGHGGRTRMEKELQKMYKNVTKEVIMLYLRLCKPCQTKLSNPKKGLVFKPVMFKESNSRGHVDLIDMQSNPDGEYKFILNYQDHLTKFMLLRALKSNSAEDVANQLLDIFTTIGAPSVLQSDNGREFAKLVISELKNKWSELKLVHGKPRQDSVKDANQDVQNMVMTWMQTNKSKHWAENLKFIQFMKNRSFNQEIQQTPYEAMFGCKAKVGLSTSNLPRELVDNLFTDEDLEKVEQQMEDATTSSANELAEKECGSARFCGSYGNNVHAVSNESDEEHTGKTTGRQCFNKQETRSKRSGAQASLQARSTKMLKIVGDTARLGTPDYDRGCSDPHSNVMNTDGTLEKTSLQTTVPSQLLTSGQDHTHCNCTSKCSTNRCKCKNNKVLCNSDCHKSQPCCNS